MSRRSRIYGSDSRASADSRSDSPPPSSSTTRGLEQLLTQHLLTHYRPCLCAGEWFGVGACFSSGCCFTSLNSSSACSFLAPVRLLLLAVLFPEPHLSLSLILLFLLLKECGHVHTCYSSEMHVVSECVSICRSKSTYESRYLRVRIRHG